MNAILNKLRRGIIVSCQAEVNTPTNSIPMIVAFAQSGQIGGAVGLRLAGAEHICAVKAQVDLPIVGIHKEYTDCGVVITGKPELVGPLVDAGAEIIAFDATCERDEGLLREIISAIHDEQAIAIADLRRFEDAERAVMLNVDALATTLSVFDLSAYQPNLALVKELVQVYELPIIAEGNYWNPDDVRQALDAGAWSVVIGSAITRPWLITRYFATKGGALLNSLQVHSD